METQITTRISEELYARCLKTIRAYSFRCLGKCKRSNTIDFDELVAEGLYVLANALSKFDPSLGTDFFAYFCRALANRCGHVTYWSYKKEFTVSASASEDDDGFSLLDTDSSHVEQDHLMSVERALDNMLNQLSLREKQYVKVLVEPVEPHEVEQLVCSKSERFKYARTKLSMSYPQELAMRKHVRELLMV